MEAQCCKLCSNEDTVLCFIMPRHSFCGRASQLYQLPHDVTLKGSQCHHRPLQGLQHPWAAWRQQSARSTARFLAKCAELPLQYNVRESGVKATLENHSTRDKDLKLLLAGLATSYNSKCVSRFMESTLKVVAFAVLFHSYNLDPTFRF